MRSSQRGVSTVVSAVLLVVLIVLGGAVGYLLGMSSSSGTPKTATITTPGGTRTVISTVTSTISVTSSRTSTSGGSTGQSTNGSSLIQMPNDQTLINAAKQEGSFTIITLLNENDMTKIKNAFQADFPWATLNFISVNAPADEFTQLSGETASGKHTIDIAASTRSSIDSYVSAGVLQSFINPVAVNNYPNGAYDPKGMWTGAYTYYYGASYNTKLLNGSKVPKNWTDFGNSGYANMLAMDDPGTIQDSAVSFAALYQTLGNASWTQLMNAIKANNPGLFPSDSAALQQVVNGVKELSVGSLYVDVVRSTGAGAPIQWIWLNPTPVSYSVAAMANGAPHPNLAKLYLEWISSVSGQKAWASIGQPAIVSSAAPAGGGPPSGITLLPLSNYYGQANNTFWKGVFTKIFDSGQ